jgi:EmrB/QacA subfamily drug resistance transporter
MRRYIIFIVIGLSLMMVAISATSISVAFPNITSYFNTSLILAGWVLDVAQLAATIIMPLAGKAGDILGGKRMFLIAIAVFTTGSLLSSIAPNIELLIVVRFIQEMGAGALLPIATAIIIDYFPDHRQQMIGLFSSIFPIGMIIGPNIGGWLVATFGWQSVFWLNIPIGMAVFIFGLIMLKPRKGQGGKVDLTGAGLLAGTLSTLMVGLSIIGTSRDKISWIIFLAAMALSGVFFYFFLRHERRAKEPIIDLEVLKGKPFRASNYFNIIYGAGVLGVMGYVPLLATSVFGMSTLASGLIMTPRSIGQVVSSFVTSMKLPKWGYRWPMLAGTILAIISLVMLGLELSGLHIGALTISGTVLLGIILFIAGFGSGVTAPAANNACIELMPNRAATITGVRGMFRQAGSAISIALTAMVLENFKYTTGFRVVFFGLAAIMVITIPFIFAMPRSAKDTQQHEVIEVTSENGAGVKEVTGEK